MKIKVCGMRDSQNIQAVSALNIDMIGFVFIPESPRYVKMIPSNAGIIPDYSELKIQEKGEDKTAPLQLKKVGVFKNTMPQTIITHVYQYELDYIQLNGDESSTMISNLLRTLIPDIAPNIKVIKKLNISSESDFKACEQFKDTVDLFLFSVGKNTDFKVFEAYKNSIPFLIGGEIDAENPEKWRDFHHSLYKGINLNEDFELEPGIKDVGKLRKFIDVLRA